MFYKKIALAIAVLFLSACASKNSTPATEITVDMNEFLFEPASITIPAGQPVVLTLTNSGAQEHDFVIEKIKVENVSAEGDTVDEHYAQGDAHVEYDLHVLTAIGGTSVLKFTAIEHGAYKIFCTIQGHEVAGMVGKLIVVESQN